MRVFVTGVAGQLGYDVSKELKKRSHIVVGADVLDETKLSYQSEWDKYVRLDITDAESVLNLVSDNSPDVIIHCAAWTNVDGAELEQNKPQVRRINVEGTDNLVKAAKIVDAKFVYISTDYVFGGEGNKAWEPDDKNFAPLNFYGETKLLGEVAVSSQLSKFFIVRISWVFGKNGNNFIKTMINLSSQGYKRLRIVNDQVGTPTYTFDLARLLVDMAETEKYGYYHATNEGGFVSWADFAEEIFKQIKSPIIVERVTTIEYGSRTAKRPYNSRMDKSKLEKNGFKLLPDWRDAVRRYLEELVEV